MSNKSYWFFTLGLIICLTGLSTLGFAEEDGAPSGNTNSPGDGKTCARVDCHTGTAQPKENLISTDVPLSGYLSGMEYTVTVTVVDTLTERFGFQASPQNLEGDKMGIMTLLQPDSTKLTGGGKYITHKEEGTPGLNSRSWSFLWTPDDASGDVTFYVAVNASDNEGDATGDKIWYGSVTVQEDPENIPVAIEITPVQWTILHQTGSQLVFSLDTYFGHGVEVSLTALNGSVLYRAEANPGTVFTVPLENAAAGVYLVHVHSQVRSFTGKIGIY